VAGYTITIAPTDDETGAETTIRVDTSSGDARITELTVRAADGGGLLPQQLPAVNLAELIAALAPSAPAIAAAPAAQPEATHTAEADAGVSEPTPQPAAPTRARSARKKVAKKAPARTRQAKAEQAAAAAQPANGRRAYRRMPESSEVLDAYRQVGGTTALARHFGVPRHTATGWLRRLRGQGLLDA
jgi:hypothetical protein